MHALVLNGAVSDDHCLVGVEQALNAALAARGWTVEGVPLRDRVIAYCQGCFECWTKTPGLCKTHDAANDVMRAIVRSDLLVLLTPVTFGGYSSELKKALDRSIARELPFFGRVNGEVHHVPRYRHQARLLAIGVAADDDEEERRVFEKLVARNAINFHSPMHVAGVVSRTATRERITAQVGALVASIAANERYAS